MSSPQVSPPPSPRSRTPSPPSFDYEEPGLVSSGKRKMLTPQRMVKELVPKDSPWTTMDWWNESSGLCRPIVEAICSSLESSTNILMGGSKIPLDESPSSVMRYPESVDSRICMDKGHVEYVNSSTGGKLWGVFHQGWGKLIVKAEPWQFVQYEANVPKEELTHLVRKPEGIFPKHSAACVATIQRQKDSEKDAAFPLKIAAFQVRVADFQCVLLKARNQLKGRHQGRQLKALKIELNDANSVDIMPIVRVIVDDEHGKIFVEDAIDVLDALIAMAGAFPLPPEIKEDNWIVEHQEFEGLMQLTGGWLVSNKNTAHSFVRLCIENSVPDEATSEKTAKRWAVDEPRSKRSKRSLPMNTT